MPSEIVCPACRHRLEVPDDAPGFPLTCPRCLARIAAQPPGPVPPGRGTLPRRAADVEIQRDTRRTGVGLVILAVLGGLGIANYLFAAGVAAVQGEVRPILIFLVSLAFLVLLSTGLVLWRTRENPAARGVGRVILGTLALAGAVFGVAFVLVVAVIIFLFIVCSLGGGRISG